MIQASVYVLAFLIAATVMARSYSVRLRQSVLLILSYAAYLSWTKWFALILLASTALNYLIGHWLRRSLSRTALWSGILLNLALLGSFKYLPEVAVRVPISSLERFSHLALPLGISFWTFQAMSYLFDLYRGEELDPTFVEFALYMSFSPIAISGPICRLTEMLPQFRTMATTKLTQILSGLRRIAVGILMMQLSRLLGQGILSGDGINSGFDHSTRWSGGDVWCLAIGFGLQLFFDFAGYSHVAIGTAQALGFTLPENFARPYESTSPAIFWTRWHMSLSFWIRDYVFLPMAMLRRESWWRNVVLIVSMVMFGIWHRASFLFVIWGCYHGALLVVHWQLRQLERRFQWQPPRIWNGLSWVITTALISFGWIFFRANSWTQAQQMLGAISNVSTYAVPAMSGSLYLLVSGLAAGYALTLWIAHVLESDTYSGERVELARSPVLAIVANSRWFWIPPLYLVFLLGVVIVTHTGVTDAAQLMYRNF